MAGNDLVRWLAVGGSVESAVSAGGVWLSAEEGRGVHGTEGD